MTSKWYKSQVARWILVLVTMISIVLVAVCGTWVFSYPDLAWEVLHNPHISSYEETDRFKYEMFYKAQEIYYGVTSREFLDENGKFDMSREIDIVEEYGSSNLKHNTTGIPVVTDIPENSAHSSDTAQYIEEETSAPEEEVLEMEAQEDIQDAMQAPEEDARMQAAGGEHYDIRFTIEDLLMWQDLSGDSIYHYGVSGDASGNIFVCLKPEGGYHYYSFEELYRLLAEGEYNLMLGSAASEDYLGKDFAEVLEMVMATPGESTSLCLLDQQRKLLFKDIWFFGYFEGIPVATNGKSLIELCNEDSRWNGNLKGICDAFSTAAWEVAAGYDNYEYRNRAFTNSNVKYFYAEPDNNLIVSNVEKYDNAKLADSYLRDFWSGNNALMSKNKYIIMNTNGEIDTNVLSEELKQECQRLFKGEPHVFALKLDTDYTVVDEFSTEHELFEQYHEKIFSSIIVAIGAVIAWVIACIWLIVIAGRTPGDDEIHLNAFDHWKTEIAAILVMTIWAIGTCILAVALDDIFTYAARDMLPASIETLMVIWSIYAIFTNALFILGTTSLAKRIKAKTWWRDSLTRIIATWGLKYLHKGAEGVIFLFENLNCLWQTILGYLLFVGFHWFILLTSSYLSFAGFLVTLAVDIVVFLILFKRAIDRKRIIDGLEKIKAGEFDYKIDVDKLLLDQKKTGSLINAIGQGMDAAVAKSMKSERLKTDLITNVSHDIKTPLTSIINYVDLLKKADIDDPEIRHYIEVLEQKSLRLKVLTEDVVEASKASSGNIHLECMNLNMAEILFQTSGEFEEKFAARELKEVMTVTTEPTIIYADGRRLYRVLENLYNNAAKYAMEGTRIYTDLAVIGNDVVFTMKNVSQNQLNISADELTERFIRGDVSRSTEGSGLGLSIAKSLTEIQGGTFKLYLDGDLFKATVTFKRVI